MDAPEIVIRRDASDQIEAVLRVGGREVRLPVPDGFISRSRGLSVYVLELDDAEAVEALRLARAVVVDGAARERLWFNERRGVVTLALAGTPPDPRYP